MSHLKKEILKVKEYINDLEEDYYKGQKVAYEVVLDIIDDSEIIIKRDIYKWLKSRFTKDAPIEYVINEFKKEFLYGKRDSD